MDPYGTGLSRFCFGVCLAGVDALKLWRPRWSKLADAGWFLMLAGMLGLGPNEVPALPAIVTYLFRVDIPRGAGCMLCYAARRKIPGAFAVPAVAALVWHHQLLNSTCFINPCWGGRAGHLARPMETWSNTRSS